jgi:hypothetical protein
MTFEKKWKKWSVKKVIIVWEFFFYVKFVQDEYSWKKFHFHTIWINNFQMRKRDFVWITFNFLYKKKITFSYPENQILKIEPNQMNRLVAISTFNLCTIQTSNERKSGDGGSLNFRNRMRPMNLHFQFSLLVNFDQCFSFNSIARYLSLFVVGQKCQIRKK